MLPKFEDPTTLKFINGKFVLATNDPKNPVQLIRQIHKDDTSKVVIYLANGVSYEDHIESLEDLIEISGNKAYEVTVEYEISLAIYEGCSPKAIERAFKKFLTFDCTFKPDFYLQTNKMIQQRIRPARMDVDLPFVKRHDDFKSQNGTITFTYLVIAPPQHISEIFECGDAGIEDTLTSRIRQEFREVSGIGISGRNFVQRSTQNADLADILLEMKEYDLEYELIVRTEDKSVAIHNPKDIDKVVSFFDQGDIIITPTDDEEEDDD